MAFDNQTAATIAGNAEMFAAWFLEKWKNDFRDGQPVDPENNLQEQLKHYQTKWKASPCKHLLKERLKGPEPFKDAVFVYWSNTGKTPNDAMEDIANIIAIDNMVQWLLEQREPRPTPATIQKLQWEGNKNQMYWVLKELKVKGLISNSYEQLADFLRQCVAGFEGAAHITITTELSRGKPPTKSKRPNLSELPPIEQEGEN
jgi:hypothetical protein